MKRIMSVFIPLALLIFSLSACQGAGDTTAPAMIGGTEAGNPPMGYRQLTGATPSLKEAGYLGTGCVAKQMTAKNQEGQEATVDIKADCSFDFLLKANTTYSLDMISFTGGVVPLMFKKESGEPGYTAEMYFKSGDSALYIGALILRGGAAYAESQDEGTAEGDGGELRRFELEGTAPGAEAESQAGETDDAIMEKVKESGVIIIGDVSCGDPAEDNCTGVAPYIATPEDPCCLFSSIH